MQKTILTQNKAAIERDILNESKAIPYLQPFVTKFLSNTYSEPISIETLRSLVYNGDVVAFLKREALLRIPELDNAPYTQEAKFNMIDPSLVFDNFTEIVALHNSLQNNKALLRLIYSYDIDSKGNLFLSNSAVERITSANTIFISEELKAVYDRLTDCIKTIQEVNTTTGFNLLRNGATKSDSKGNYYVNPELFAIVCSATSINTTLQK